MKTCNKCYEEKPETEFYRHHNECKECVKRRVRLREQRLMEDPSWRLAELRRHREKSAKARANGAAAPQSSEAKINWRARNPEKYKAHIALNNAIRAGRIQREPCHCGRPAHAHHNDYSKPLEVRWLCAEHHAEHHVKLRESLIS